jgi:uncharacterized protein YjbI with pentapeptide repeats
MAKKAHLQRLEGLSAWNAWRQDHPNISIDLSRANLREADLQGLNLSGADLYKADLRDANLRGTNLSRVDLRDANLRDADLSRADLSRADLSRADLSRADLTGAHLMHTTLIEADLKEACLENADLREANLSEANLSRVWIDHADLSHANLSSADFSHANIRATLIGADLSDANLRGAHLEADLSGAVFSSAVLVGAHLSGADLTGAYLSGVDLRGLDLSRVNLRQANLRGLNLSGSDLSYADLTGTDCRLASLVEVKLNGATLTDAWLWETQRAGWSIQGIICEAVYWDKDRKERATYSPGEFERLFADKTKIVLYYEGGISPIEIATLPALIQRIEAAHPGCVLRLQSIEEAPGGATVTLIVDEGGGRNPAEIAAMKAEMEEQGRRLLSAERRASEEEAQRLHVEHTLRYLSHEVLPRLLESGRPNYSFSITGGKQTMGDTYIAGQVGAQGPHAHAHDINFNQLWSQARQSLDLQALAAQLATLRQHLRQEAVEPEHDAAIGVVASAEMAAKEGNGPKTFEFLSKAGQWTLDNAAKIGVGIATAALKTALGL